MLVDAGESARGWDAGRNVITPFLRERGVRVVDRAVISHGDGDHWGGLAYLADHMRIKELVLPAGVPLGPLGELVPVLEARGTTVRWVEAGDTLPPFGDLESVVIHPSGRFEELHGSELGDDLNDRSLVLRVKYGEVVFLMTGDVERAAEQWLVVGCEHSGDGGLGSVGECKVAPPNAESNPSGSGFAGDHPALSRAPLDCTVMKVPHHGSDTSSSAEFVLRTSPILAVISCGPKARFNLPKPQVLDRYRLQGVSLMMTARDGALIVKTDGRRVVATPYLRPSEASELSFSSRACRRR